VRVICLFILDWKWIYSADLRGNRLFLGNLRLLIHLDIRYLPVMSSYCSGPTFHLSL
jgi:hypothetical protein